MGLLPGIEMGWRLNPCRPIKPAGFVSMDGPTRGGFPGRALAFWAGCRCWYAVGVGSAWGRRAANLFLQTL
ncbi:MAG: hypothetical protein N0E48_24615 [Candidatus Thiodiazotropha endolucinida]|nr:hypothetical protein [Candidatus Thiodiazotropha endolucinida]